MSDWCGIGAILFERDPTQERSITEMLLAFLLILSTDNLKWNFIRKLMVKNQLKILSLV